MIFLGYFDFRMSFITRYRPHVNIEETPPNLSHLSRSLTRWVTNCARDVSKQNDESHEVHTRHLHSHRAIPPIPSAQYWPAIHHPCIRMNQSISERPCSNPINRSMLQDRPHEAFIHSVLNQRNEKRRKRKQKDGSSPCQHSPHLLYMMCTSSIADRIMSDMYQVSQDEKDLDAMRLNLLNNQGSRWPVSTLNIITRHVKNQQIPHSYQSPLPIP